MVEFLSNHSEQFFLFNVFVIFASVLAALRMVFRGLKVARLADNRQQNVRSLDIDPFPKFDQIEGTISAISGLIDFAKSEKPVSIVGVHTGGRLVSVLACEELKLNKSQCHFVSTDIHRDRKPFFTSGVNGLHGKVLFIDDVTRTGSTLEIIRRNLVSEVLSRGPSAREQISTSFATLLLSNSRKRFGDGFFLPDWSAFSTDDPEQVLPWSPLSAQVRSAYLNLQAEKDYDPYPIRVHDKLVEDFDFALFCAKLALYENARFISLLESKSLIDDFEYGKD